MFRDKPSARKLRRWTIIAAIALGSVIATLLLGKIPFFHSLHLKAGDLHFLVRGKIPTSNIVIITIDNKSLDHFEELMMFWHPYYAEAIRAAAEGGAKVLGLDNLFVVGVGKWEPENDAILMTAVNETAATMPVICGFMDKMTSTQKKWPVPVNMLAASLNQFGFVNLTSDPDDFIRNQVFEEPTPDGQFNRGMALRVAEKFRGVDAKIENGRLMFAGGAIPILPSFQDLPPGQDPDLVRRTITINYAGPPGTFPFISLSDFIEASRAGQKDRIRQWVGGKAVLIGPDLFEDRHPTPFYTPFSGEKYNTAGIEIHANTLRTLLDGDYLLPVSQPVRMLSLMLAAGMTVLVAASLTPAQSAYWLAAAIAATAVMTHLMFRAGVMISTSELYLAGLISLLSSTIFRFLTAEKRGSFFQNAISVFVGKKFAADISEEQHISLSGSRQLVTILFSDIRGFTAFCEEKDPAVVVDLLNEYMGGMVKVIVNYHGNVNKFIGDGILAIFSDEDGTISGDHALRAVRCGTEMVQLPGRFRTGVGIHTGFAVVGNVGSQDKMEYTVLGDTVNLASRLESLNKEMKTQLILSEATRELLNGQFETVYLGDVPIRGKTAPLVVHTSAVLRPSRQKPGTLAEKS
jgi:adenylate cyclase